jgi:hypothetical protein
MNNVPHRHGAEPRGYNKAFGFGIALNAAYIVVQVTCILGA